MTLSSEPLYPVAAEMKICSRKDCKRAGIFQPWDNFPKSRQVKSGRLACCKSCFNEAHRLAAIRRKELNPEKFKDQCRAKNIRQRERQKKWRKDNEQRLREAMNKWRLNNPEKLRAARERARFRKFGISSDWYTSKLAEQRGQCAICGRTKPGGLGNTFHVDHDHGCCDSENACGKCLRGLLCASCNVRLGVVESAGWLGKALAYLSKYKRP